MIYINGQKWEPITESDRIALQEYLDLCEKEAK